MNRTLQSRLLHGSLCPRLLHGEMAERFNAAVLKTAVGQPTVGSNPTLSASFSVRAPSEDEALIFDRKGTGGNSDRRLFSDRGCVLDRGL